MHVFVLGADSKRSLGIAVTKGLAADGHEVTAPTWFDSKVRERKRGPIDYVKGELGEPAIMRLLDKADAVIDTSFPNIHRQGSLDRLPPSEYRPRVLRRLLASSGKPLIVTSGWAVLGNTRRTPIAEGTPARPLRNFAWLRPLEQEILRARDIRGVVIRPAIEYGSLLTYGVDYLASIATQRRRGTYIGTGNNRWSFVHYQDLADLYRVALANAKRGLVLHAAAVTFTQREIATAIHRAHGYLGEPDGISLADALRYSIVAKALQRNHAMCGDAARELGWQPSRPSLPDHLYEALSWHR
jgi:nucleoside-diphosphate-sugar epimerase